MNKVFINIPNGINYLSEWKGFFEALPVKEHFILNKKICGCGATEAFLRTEKNVILCSPRKQLLLNKFKQHTNDDFHLFRYTGDDQVYLRGKDTEETLKQHKSSLGKYVKMGGKKILTIFDSLHHIIEVITEKDCQEWLVVVDEAQCMFCDSHYKADTELNFYKQLDYFPSVIYLSATPFLEEYLDKVSLFNKLTMYELVWEQEKLVKPDLIIVNSHKSIYEQISEIVGKYKSGKGNEIEADGGIYISKEAVLFVNSVSVIIRAVKKSGLKPEEVNIICSSTPENLKKIQSGLGNGFEIGFIPGKGEPHKMFTFCTCTVYVGADFYSTSAYTYIFANPQIKSMAVDVSVDLQQILGRQRLVENPFKNMATLFFSTTLTEYNAFKDCQKKKEEETTNQIANFNAVPNKESQLRILEQTIKQKGHESHYCSIVKEADGKVRVVRNELIQIAEKRAWDILDKIYKNEYTMCLSLKNDYNINKQVDSDDKDIQDVFQKWDNLKSFSKRAKYYCDLCEQQPDSIGRYHFIPPKYQKYFEAFGREGMEALKWREDNLKQAIAPNPFTPLPTDEIGSILTQRLQEQKSFAKSDVKKILAEIYDSLGLKLAAKATDLNNYFSCEETSERIGKKKVAKIKIKSFYRKDVSLFPSIMKPDKSEKYDVDKILDIIKTNSYFKVKEKVEKVRSSKTDKERSTAKLQLPAVTWNGVFKTKHSTDITSYSSFTALDFDKIESERMDGFKKWLESFGCVYAFFVTPSGKGYKAIILHDNYRHEYHTDLYNQLLKLFDCSELDKSTCDLARGNYLSYDPDLWLNPEPVPFHFTPTTAVPVQPTATYTAIKDGGGNFTMVKDESESTIFLNKLASCCYTDESIINMLNKLWSKKPIAEGERNNRAMCYAGILCKAGVNKEMAQQYLEGLIPNFDVSQRIEYAYSHNDFGCQRYRFLKKKH